MAKLTHSEPLVYARELKRTLLRRFVLTSWLDLGFLPSTCYEVAENAETPLEAASVRIVMMQACSWGWGFNYPEPPPRDYRGRPHTVFELIDQGAIQIHHYLKEDPFSM